jgi:ATP-binding cassette, subfamily B, bacterial PglK
MFQILSLLNRVQKAHLKMLCVFIVLSVLLELIGLSLIIPVIAFLDNPTSLQDFFPTSINSIDLTNLDEKKIGIYLFSLILTIFIIKNFFLAYFKYFEAKFINNTIFSVGKNVFFKIFDTDYIFKKYSNSSEIINSISKETHLFGNSLISTVNIVSECLIIFAFSSFLLIYDFKSFLFAFVLLFIFSFLFFLSTRKKIQYWGRKRKKQDENRIKYILDGFSGVKDIKVYCKDNKFKNMFDNLSEDLAKNATNYNFFSAIPKLYLEVIILITLCSLIIYFLNIDKSFKELLTFISITFLAAIRIFPSANKVILGFQTISYAEPSVLAVKEYLRFKSNSNSHTTNQISNIKEKLVIKDLSFSYANSKKKLLKNLNAVFNLGEIVGFKGSSGAGKSTLINLILGFLKPSSGKIAVDNKDLDLDYLKTSHWKKKFSYVPQSVYLFDESIKYNITLEDDEKKIDKNSLENSIKLSCLDQFILERTDGIDFKIGEKGLKISGGEKQRIGIARALYRNSQVYIFDEATSSIDEKTEKKIFENIISNLFKDKIFILCSHNKNLLSYCKKVIDFDDNYKS